MSSLGDIKNALKILLNNGLKKKNIVILHCHSDYPTNLKDVNLIALKSIEENFKTKVGYSDHTLGFETAISAVAMGASVIEKHITLNRKMIGQIIMQAWNQTFLKFTKSIRNTEELMGSFKKTFKIELKTKRLIRKSIVAKFDIKKGDKFLK